jgi:trehalose-6-phosphate synthase
MSVNYHGRIVLVRVSHIGIDEEFIKYIMSTSTFRKQVEKFQQEFKMISLMA